MKLFVIQLTVIFMLLSGGMYSQDYSNDFKTTVINKKVKEYANKYSLKTPLNAFITYANLYMNGKEGKLKAVSSHRIKESFNESAPDSKVTKEEKERFLNTTINEIIVYKDSVACVLSDYYDPGYSIRFLTLEKGEWLNSGENMADSLPEARDNFIERVGIFIKYLREEI